MNVAFSRTDSSIDVTFKSVQSLNDEEQVKGDDEDDCITPQDMMSFSWQITQGMVSEKRFVHFNCAVRVISCSTCPNAGKFSINYSKLPSSLGRLDGSHSVVFLRDHACLNRIALLFYLEFCYQPLYFFSLESTTAQLLLKAQGQSCNSALVFLSLWIQSHQ